MSLFNKRRRCDMPAHRATTANLQAVYPFVAEGGLGGRGVYIGKDAYGGSFVFDPFELYSRGMLESPNMTVFGGLGFAKSSLIKSYLWRQVGVFGRRALVIDKKGEYKGLAAALGCQPLRLVPGGDIVLNPLAAPGVLGEAGKMAQLEIACAVAAAALRRGLEPEEEQGITEALRVLRARVGEEPTIPALVELLFRPTEDMAARVVCSRERLAADVRRCALALRRLCEGDLRGMFDARTTPGIELDARLLVLDLEAVGNSAALGILMACATAAIRAQLDARRARMAAEGRPMEKLIVVVDEAWRVFSLLGVGEWLQETFKLSRHLGVQNVIVMHRLSDLSAAGAEGSRELRLIEGLLEDAATHVLYNQPAGVSVRHATELLDLTETEAELLPTLGKGQALWKVGSRSFFVYHRRSRLERELTDTDAGMLDRHESAEVPDTPSGEAEAVVA
jgi:type IV secretory pathway VirB4 component